LYKLRSGLLLVFQAMDIVSLSLLLCVVVALWLSDRGFLALSLRF